MGLAGCGGEEGDPGAGADGGPPELCRPSGGGPHWLTEEETLDLSIGCALDHDLAGEELVLDPVPPGASWDAATGRLRWTPGLDQAAVYRVRITAPSLGEEGELVIGVADAWDHPDNLPIADRLAYPMEYGVPVFFLDPAPVADEPYVPVTIVYGGRTWQAEGKLRGASSLNYPKKSYTLKFPGERFSDPDQDGGFAHKRRVVLTTAFDDNSYIRQWLAFELWSRMEPTIPVQAYPAVVYDGDQFRGVYTVTDHVDDDLMQASGLSERGNLYKAINHDANFRLTNASGDPKATLHDGFEKKEGAPEEGQPGAFDDLDELVEFVASADDATFAAEIGERVELADYEKWWALVTFIRADDSAGKNTYHYHDATRSWRVVPWDFNASFGQAWTTRRLPASPVDPYTGANRLFERLLADPELRAGMLDRARALHGDGPLALGEVLGLVDEMTARVEPVARRDWARWEAEYRAYGLWSDRTDWTGFDEEVAYLRAWLGGRSSAVADLLAD